MKIFSVLLLISIFWIACTPPEENTATEFSAVLPDAKHVEILELVPTVFNDIIELTGTVEAKSDVTVSARTTGTLEMIAPLGQTVSSGDVIAQIEDNLLRATVSRTQAQINNALAALNIAQDSYTRQEPLFADSIISPLEFNRLVTNLEQARAALTQAETLHEQALLQLGYTTVTAPISGKVEARYIVVGEQINPGTPILRMVDVQNVQITAGISERYAGDIEVGTPAEVRLPTAGILSRNGSVSFAGNVIDPASRSFEIKLQVDNEDGRLKPEMIAQLAILRLRIEDAIVIPGNAVTRTENGLSVFTIEQQDNTQIARIRTVILGAEYSNQVVVLSGLSPGEQVVVRGQSTLGDRESVIIDQSYSELNENGIPIQSTDAASETE